MAYSWTCDWTHEIVAVIRKSSRFRLRIHYSANASLDAYPIVACMVSYKLSWAIKEGDRAGFMFEAMAMALRAKKSEKPTSTTQQPQNCSEISNANFQLNFYLLFTCERCTDGRQLGSLPGKKRS